MENENMSNEEQKPALQQTDGVPLSEVVVVEVQFDKEYVHSHTDAIAFMGKMQHETEYEVLDLVKNKWIKQRYTFLVDNNEQEQTQKMIHNFRMGWCRLCNDH
jgi:hypothetical protein